MHNPEALFWHTFYAVRFEGKQKKGVVNLTHQSKLSKISALTENTQLASKTLESLCVGDEGDLGCSILSSVPLSINLSCLSHHFDQGESILTAWISL